MYQNVTDKTAFPSLEQHYSEHNIMCKNYNFIVGCIVLNLYACYYLGLIGLQASADNELKDIK